MRATLILPFIALLFNSSLCQEMTTPYVVSLEGSPTRQATLSGANQSTVQISVHQQIQDLIEKSGAYQNTLPDSSILYAQEAARLAIKNKINKQLATAQFILGSVAWNKRDYSSASIYFFQASSLREQMKDSIGIADCYIRIGHSYMNQKNINAAQAILNKAEQICERKNYAKGKIDLDISLAELYTLKEEHELASNYIDQALVAARKEAYRAGEMNALFLLGQRSFKKSDFQQAYDFFIMALHKEAQVNDLFFRMKTLPVLASASLHLHDETMAKELVLESIALSDQLKHPENKIESLTILSRVYEKLQLFEKAYEVEKQRFDLNDSLANEKLEKAITEVKGKYMDRDLEVKELQSYNEMLKSKQKVSQMYLVTALILVLSICISIGFLYVQLRLKSKSNLLLSEKNKELFESNTALERYAYVASHDLKEPLRTISSFTSLIARKYNPLLDDKGKEYVKFVTEGVAHMNYLLDDLLRYSRLVNNKDFVPVPVNLNQVVASVEQMLAHQIEERKASIQYSNMPVVQSSSSHMHQLFQNLIVNGLKFNDNPEPIIQINCTTEKNKHLFSIKDNGIGIEEQYHGKIFEMFQRLSKNDYPGTGMGLSICQKIIEINKGKLWLESKPGEGTTFFFYLPAEEAN
jgi:nitrogen-specific signal transduction histidine kinase